jgi:bifunctional non-homologous end joining protein LigD
MEFQFMLPTLRKFPFSHPDWIFEPKWDGYRALCMIDHKSVRFMSRNRKELTKRFPELSIVHRAIKGQSAILDGEIVALDENGRPCFENLQNRVKGVVAYFAFDCLMLNGNDVRNEPLIVRKSLLKALIKKSPLITFTEYVVEDGKQLFVKMEELGLEGVVAKRADSLYGGGRTKEWLKIKTRSGSETMRKRIETWGR